MPFSMPAELSPTAALIVGHTRQLLAEGGYNSFSYADLSERVNITKASIHHHFASKELLVKAVVQGYRRDAAEGLASLALQLNDPVAELNAYAAYWAGCIRSGESPFCICAMLATEMPTIPEDVATEVKAHFATLLDWLTSVMERGLSASRFQLAAGMSPADAARNFLAAVHGAMLVARATGDAGAFEAIVQPAIVALTRTH